MRVRPALASMNPKRARLLAEWAHRAQLQSPGEPLMAHVRRVAAATPRFARAVAWLHEALEWTSVSEEELLANGLSEEELRAVRLLTHTGRSEARYLAHIAMIARAHGLAGELARAVKVADLRDRLQHPDPRTNGSRLPYEQALEMLLDRPAAGGSAERRVHGVPALAGSASRCSSVL
jgi:hypothetical protein